MPRNPKAKKKTSVDPVTVELKQKCKELVGKTESKITNIDINHLWGDRFRVDAWVENWSFEHQVYPGNRIEKSFFIKYDEKEGLTDLTKGSCNGKWEEIFGKFPKKK